MHSSTSNSDASASAATPADRDRVERVIPQRPWTMLIVASLVATIALTLGWEVYWRGKGFVANDFQNGQALWAQERRKVTGDATVIIGSSRVYYGIDLDVWEEMTGIRPVQLALEGTSPRFLLQDLADDERFHGHVIIGVTTLMFFTQTGGLKSAYLSYAKQQSLSQRLDHKMSMALERVFAFLDEQTRPKRQVALWPLPLREGMKTRFDPRKLEVVTADRNAEVWDRVLTDERYRQEAKDQWLLVLALMAPPPAPDGGPPPPMPDEAIDAVINEVSRNIEKIRARGGDVGFIRLPYGGPFVPVENGAFPRERFWDRLLVGADAAGVSFEDVPALPAFELPEDSHLAARDAETFTRIVAPIYMDVVTARRARAATAQP